MEQLQGDDWLGALGVQDGAVGPRPAAAPGHRAEAVEATLQRVVGQGLDLGPVQPGRPGPEHRGPDGAAAEAETLGDRPVAQGELLTQDLAGVAHGQSLGGHSSPFRDGWRLGRPAPPPAILPRQNAWPAE